MRIRIQGVNFNADPCRSGSGSKTLLQIMERNQKDTDQHQSWKLDQDLRKQHNYSYATLIVEKKFVQFIKSASHSKTSCKKTSQNLFIKLQCSREVTKWVFCDFAKYEITQIKTEFRKMILPKFRENFAKHISYFARFPCVISFAKKISRNFVKRLFREMVLPKFREISRILFLFREIS